MIFLALKVRRKCAKEKNSFMTSLLLIRHAANDWVGDRLAGWTPGVHLNDQGRQQATTLAEHLARWPIEAIYSSPLERAVETAEIVAAPHGLAVNVEEDVGEARYGEWTGASIKELSKKPEWMQVQFNPSSARFPGGESLGEMQARAVAAIERLRVAHPKGVIAVFSHADVIKAITAHYAGIHMDLFQRLVVGTASVTWFQFSHYGPRLICLNNSGDLEPPKPEAEKPEDGQAEPEPPLLH